MARRNSNFFNRMRLGIFGALIGILLLGLGIYFFSSKRDVSLELKVYADPSGVFSFRYMPQFVIEKDTDESLIKRYGLDYIVGFRHTYDPRIGCEIRKNDGSFSLDLPEQDISWKLVTQYSKDTKEFSLVRSGKVVLQGNMSAFQFSFTFVDPLDATMLIHQVFIPHGKDMYLLTCGSGRAYSEKFESDFETFFSSFVFNE